MALQFNVNNPTTAPANAILPVVQALKQEMLAAGWTLVSSSDGVTSALGAAGDQTKLNDSGAGGLGDAFSWFVLQQPASSAGAPYDGKRMICFQHRGDNGGPSGNTFFDQFWRIKYSASGGFPTSGQPSAGPKQTPSAADEQFILGGGTDAAPTFGTWFSGTSAALRYNVVVDDGQSNPASPFAIWAAAWPSPGGTPNWVFAILPMLAGSFPSGETDPFVFYADGISGQTLFTASLASSSPNGPNGPKGWIGAPGQAGSTWGPVTAMFYANNDGLVIPANLGVNAISQKDDNLPIPFARRPSVGGATGWKGLCTFARWRGSNRAVADHSTVQSANDRIIVADTVLPWNGSVALN
jgi:hypothetical protein